LIADPIEQGSLTVTISSWLSWPLSHRQARRGQRRNPASRPKTARLVLEPLEGRALLTTYDASRVSALIAGFPMKASCRTHLFERTLPMLRRYVTTLALAVLSMSFFAIASGSPQAQVPQTGTQKTHTQKADTQKALRVFEMWMYVSDHTKHDQVDQHFRNHAVPLYQKHGIELIGTWTIHHVEAPHVAQDQKHAATPVQNPPSNAIREKHAATPNASPGFTHPTTNAIRKDQKHAANDTVVALLAFPSHEAAAASWKAMATDPEWTKEVQATIRGHYFIKAEKLGLQPTDYSPMR
jgi:NIPSNAP